MPDIFNKVNIIKYLKNNYKEQDYEISYKFSEVKAKKGKLGQQVKTIMQDGFVETINIVNKDKDNNKLDRIITNINNEKYVISYKVFIAKYEKDYKNKRYYKPKKNLVVVVELKDSISFIAPWGEVMNIKKGGFLIINNQDDIYGIQEQEFYDTYTFCEPFLTIRKNLKATV